MSDTPNTAALAKCFWQFRELIEGAGPASMEAVLDLLSSLVNSSSLHLKEIGQDESARLCGEAWLKLYAAEKAVQP